MTDHAATPPQNLDAEESVLGAMLISERAIDAVSDVLAARDFYRESHGRIYTTIVALYATGVAVDAITVADKLDEEGVLQELGGKERIHELAALVPATSNVTHYARIVREMAALRDLVLIGEKISRLGWDRPGEATELIAEAEQLVFDLARGRVRQDITAIGADLDSTLARLQELAAAGESIVGVPTGLDEIDAYTSGFQPGNLIVVGARPSMGKSAFALSVAAHVSIRLGKPTLIFTLEMSRAEILQRLLSSEARVDSRRIRNGSLGQDEWRRLMKAAVPINKAPLFVEDSAALTMNEIRAKARRFAAKNPDLALIVVDYLQLMTSGVRAENRVQEVSQISRSLKVLASELGVPVLAVSQLSRQVEQRHDKRPILPDLRESGQVEQDADIVLFLYRDAYYNPEDAIEDGTEGMAEVIFAKQRNGPTGTVKVAFVKQYALFGNLAPGESAR